MSAFSPTTAQRQVIFSTQQHLLVAAGAGSGKTETVINRLLFLLGVPIDGQTIVTPVPVARVAAITFTLASAAELKDRVRKGLAQADRRDLAAQVDSARIGTIHGFCGDILGEFALRRGGSPAITVVDEGDARALAEEAARDALVEAVEAGDAGIESLLATRQQRDIHQALLTLLAQGNRLHRLAAAAALPAAETALLRLAQRGLDLLEQRLKEQGQVDFDRMLSWTRDLIRDDAYARRTLQRRIHSLIIDEFQDVDPVQWEMARLLGEPESGRPDTPRLLLVGDPKQSVYRFRNADITTWRTAERDLAASGGQVVPLNENFRSTAPILDFVAATTGVLLDTPLDPEAGRQDWEIEFARLEVGDPDKQGDGPPVELIAVPASGVKAADVRQLEAEAIARRAVEHHAAGIAWGKMALLFASWTDSDLYQAALARHGIPTYLRRETGFHERREVIDQILALEAVRDPTDDRALMGFLRSPFVGVRDETLLTLALSGEGPCWPRLKTVSCAEPGLIHQGVELLERAIALRDRVPHDELLAGLLEQSGYWAHLALMGKSKHQAVANIRKFLQLIRGGAESSLGDVLRTLAAERKQEVRVGDARLHGESDDVVTLTTIHSAKGLQWEVVFWCDLERQPNHQTGGILIGRHGVALRDPERSEQSEEFTALKEAIQQEEDAEKKRLWYVAATRAKRHLCLSPFSVGVDKLPASTAATLLRATLTFSGEPGREGLRYPRHGGGEWEALVHLADANAVPAAAASGEPAPIPDAAVETVPVRLPPHPAPAGRLLHSASEALVLSRCERKHWYQYVLGLREPPLDRTGTDFGSAVARGQVVHDVLDQYRVDAELDALIADAVRKWDPDAPAPETEEGGAYRAALRHELEAVLADPGYREVAGLPGARHELGFVHLDGGGRGWQGALDLAAATAAGQVLLDIKTGGKGGDVDWARMARQYEAQRDVYAAAASAIAGQPVAEFRFHFSQAGHQVRHSFSAEELAGLAPRLRAMAERMESGEPQLTQHPEECRFCGFKAVGWCPGVGGS